MGQRIMLSISYHIIEPFLLFSGWVGVTFNSKHLWPCRSYNNLQPPLLLPAPPIYLFIPRNKVESNLRAVCLS